MQHSVVGVLGASGGLGASTLSVALAARASPRAGTVACVDGDFAGGGLDVTACLEHLPGLRWPDLAGVRGDLDGAALVQALPCERSVAVLASRGVSPADVVVQAALDGLRAVCGLTVIDLGRCLALVSACTGVVLVAGTSARRLADADAMARRLADHDSAAASSTVLVVRSDPAGHVPAEDVAHHLDLPLGAVLRHDPRVVRDADRGVLPGELRSPLATAAEGLLAQLEAVGSTVLGGVRR